MKTSLQKSWKLKKSTIRKEKPVTSTRMRRMQTSRILATTTRRMRTIEMTRMLRKKKMISRMTKGSMKMRPLKRTKSRTIKLNQTKHQQNLHLQRYCQTEWQLMPVLRKPQQTTVLQLRRTRTTKASH